MNNEWITRLAKALVIAAIVLIILVVLLALMGSGQRGASVSSQFDESGTISRGQGMVGDLVPPETAATHKRNGTLGAPIGVSGSLEESFAADAAGDMSAPPEKPKVIRTGSLTLRVDDADWTVGEIENIARVLGGSVQTADINDNGAGMKSGSLTIKVPLARFDEALERVKKTGSLVINEALNSQDVTMQYTDLQARLRNKQQEEQAFAKILETDSTKIQDILAVTRELSRVRGEIEQLQAQITYLESQTDMALINIFLSEDPRVGAVDQWRPWQVVKEAVNQLIRVSQNFMSGLIQFVIVVVPVLILYGLILWLLYRGGKKVYDTFKS